MLKKSIIPLALLTMSTVANAGGYVGIGLGQSSVDIQPLDLGPGVFTSVSDTDTSVKLFGGFEFNHNFAVEAGYADLGEASVDYTDLTDSMTESFEANALYVAAVGSIPVGQASLFGKVGFASWDMDYSVVSTFGVFGTASASGTDPMFGLGVKFDATNTLMLRAEFERFMDVGDQNATGQADVDVLSVGAALKF